MTADDSVCVFLRSLSTHAFWGAVTIKFENGHVVHVRREENLKLNNLLPNNKEYQDEYKNKN